MTITPTGNGCQIEAHMTVSEVLVMLDGRPLSAVVREQFGEGAYGAVRITIEKVED